MIRDKVEGLKDGVYFLSDMNPMCKSVYPIHSLSNLGTRTRGYFRGGGYYIHPEMHCVALKLKRAI